MSTQAQEVMDKAMRQAQIEGAPDTLLLGLIKVSDELGLQSQTEMERAEMERRKKHSKWMDDEWFWHSYPVAYTDADIEKHAVKIRASIASRMP